WTFDPREDVEIHDLPFILWDFQEEYVDWLNERIGKAKDGSKIKASDGATLKTRDMGLTWVVLAWAIHKWLFEPGFEMLLGSEKEEKVDDNTKDSHFGRLQYIVSRLPGWLLPRGFEMRRHRTRMKLVNPENGNTLKGDSAHADFGRGGRFRCIFFDEFAAWDYQKEAWSASSESTRCRMMLSTPKGGTNFFAQFYKSNRSAHFEAPWWRHPKKDQAWYDAQKERLTPEEMAENIDMSFEASQEGVIYPGINEVPLGHFPYVSGWPLWCSMDYGYDDDTALIWWQRDPVSGRVRMIDAYQNSKKPIDFYIPFLTGQFNPEHDFDYSDADLEK
ncbi:terminase large subunit domain-containing protein, partial [Nitrolancea hollandica]|uniref:terminase large subunit domain-containing protein n=1 Tax=Nitrolancea hollandica TaxID=1206749 RepID=UPI00058B6E4E